MPQPESGFLPQNLSPRVRFALMLLALALAYFAIGRASLMLAVPPGYATPVWPAAGVAFAGLLLGGLRYWPAVLIGSFLVNFPVHMGSDGLTPVSSVLVPLVIGAGAALQAAVGVLLARRFVPSADVLSMEWGVARLVLVGGPIACLVSATIAVLTLTISGVIQLEGSLFSFLTWWVGDSIGVLICTPLVLLWASAQRDGRTFKRMMISAPLLMLLGLSVFIFLLVSHLDQQRLEGVLEQRAQELSAKAEKSLSSAIDALVPLRAYLESSDHVTRSEFESFATPILENHASVSALGMAELLPQGRLESFAEEMRSQGLADFEIKTIDAPDDEFALVLSYIEPYRENAAAQGLDLLSESHRRQAARSALGSRRAVATHAIHLVQDAEGRQSNLVLMDFQSGLSRRDYAGSAGTGDAIGVVSAVFETEETLKNAFAVAAAWGISYEILDITDPANPEMFFTRQLRAGEQAGFLHESEIHWAGRDYLLRFMVSQDYLLAHRSWQAWGVLVGALLFCGLLGVVLISLAGRQRAIESEVEHRTRALEQMTSELQRSNEKLEEFAYVVSHDLKAPLRSIAGFVTLIRRRYEKDLPEGAREFFGLIQTAADNMHEMIDGILTLSRVGRNGKAETFEANEVLERVKRSLSAEIRDKSAVIESDALPTMHAVRLEFEQLLQNLVSNAIKFGRPAPCVVKIAVKRCQMGWQFSVTDAGPGIRKDLQDQLFRLFHRLDPDDGTEGQGIGLAVCQRIVKSNGGEIWVESELGQGTTMFFIWPDWNEPEAGRSSGSSDAAADASTGDTDFSSTGSSRSGTASGSAAGSYG